MDINFLLQKGIEFGSFFAAFVGLLAAFIMFEVTKKFGSGILASGFKRISIGVAMIGLAMVLDAILLFVQLQMAIIPLLKVIFLIAGTYIIVDGTKSTADKLESLSKKD